MRSKFRKGCIIMMAATLIFCLSCFLMGLAPEKVDAEDMVENPTVEIVAQNLSYSDSVFILYAVKNSGFNRQNYEIEMLFWDSPQDKYQKGSEIYSATNKGSDTVFGENCLIFYSYGIAAKEMVDNVYARACVEINGVNYYSQVKKYSVVEYVYEQKEIGSLTNEQLALFDAMLEYGAASQKVLKYKENRLANDTYYKVTTENGNLPDGFASGRYLAGEKVVIKANPSQAGNYFSHWEKNGVEIDGGESLEITVENDVVYTAKYSENLKVDGFEFKLETNGEFTIVGYTGTESELVIPEKYEETFITAIADEAFKNNTTLQKIELSTNIESIGNYAFSNCENLSEIKVEESLKTIGEYAFEYCENLTTVYYVGDAQKWESITGFENIGNAKVYYYSAEEPALNSDETAYNGNYWHYTEGGEEKVWEINRTYTFETNGGLAIGDINAVTLTVLPYPTKDGFSFVGWYDNAELSGEPITAPYTSATKLTLYAKWEQEAQKDGSSFENAIEIAKGKTYQVDIVEADGKKYFVFTATNDRTWTISSNGDLDTLAVVYDYNEQYITENDDGLNAPNFEVEINVEAGNTYYIEVSIGYGVTGTFTITVR